MTNFKSQITGIRKIAGDKYSLTLSQVVVNPEASLNVAALFNASDIRFADSQPKARQCFIPAEAADIKALLGLDVSTLQFTANDKGHMMADVLVNDPKIHGYSMNIELREFTDASKARTVSPKNVTTKEGQVKLFVDEYGNPIYQGCFVVTTEPKHRLLQGTMIDSTVDQVEALKTANIAAQKALKEAKVAAGPVLVEE